MQNRFEDKRNDEEELGADKIESAKSQREEPAPAPKPSQAEGDPETIDAALRQQETEE